MDNLIEVEIENRSYIELLNLNKYDHKTLNLTTLVDNQASVIIKVFLNKAGKRVLLKEFYIRNLKRKVSGLPRFELTGSYIDKFLSLKLRVDGKKTESIEIKLTPYLRNKLVPLFILFGIISLLLLFWGGKWILNTTLFRSDYNIQSVNTEPEIPIPTTSIKEKSQNTETSLTEDKTSKTVITNETKTFEYTVYFLPDDNRILEDAARVLNNTVLTLKTKSEAKVEISGHCAMTGTKEGRDRLSKERAYKVLDYFKKKGWDPAEQPKIKWFGGTQPVTTDPDKIYKNRRVEIEIILP